MIKINKTQPAPRYLIHTGTSREEDKCYSETQAACIYFESENDDSNKKSEYKFDSNIYGNRIWRSQLLEDQHNKCCFCESRFLHVSAGDVEHFRPKGGYKQSVSDSLQKPGYYWLAYEWDNLLIACENCNRIEKKNLFPLLNPENRATKENKDIDAERPIFINPWKEDPENFIEFHCEIPIGIDSEGRGTQTIELLNLDKNKVLSEIRAEKLYIISTIIEKIEKYGENIPNPKDIEYIVKSLDESSAYAGMIRSNFEDKINEIQKKYLKSTT
ncbi:MAG TPA: hypothetical protein HA262_03245 [Methanosarcina sp.]|jgi:uncharacterized protein (TIGR02646 family)|nr:hypothetical protein [Methanosarcina sp.]